MFKYLRLLVFCCVIAGLIGIPALHAEWIEDGVAVCTITGSQDYPVVVSDGSGGAIIAWRDARPVVNTDIYAQRVDADGNILWMDIGMPVCTASNSQSGPAIISDGAGGAIIAWNDTRTGGTVDIYAQRLNSDGYIQWTGDGVPICTGQTGLVMGQMISDGSGGAIITWHDRRNFYNDVFVQRINASGAVQWTANGVTVCAASMHQMNPSLASDGTGGAIVAWQDNRNDSNDIYAQRVDATGNVVWTADGIVVCNSWQQQTSPRVITDGSGGAVIAWMDYRNTLNWDIFAQRIDANGSLMWSANGIVISATVYDQRDCRIVPVGSGEAIVTWVDYRSNSSYDIYAQKIDMSGTVLWTSNGVAVCTAAGDQTDVQITSNGPGGAIAAWEDERSGSDLYAQRINADGSPGWDPDGVAICSATGNQTMPHIAYDGYGGAVIAWNDERGGVADIYGQRVDAAGQPFAATLLYNYLAVLSGSDIEIEWTLSEAGEDIDFYILRASEPSMMFSEILFPDIIRDGTSYSFIDKDCEPSTVYHYRVDVREGSERKILFETGPINTPAMMLTLYQNVPNPFNPITTIRYAIAERCHVTLEVFDVAGRRITVLVDKKQSAGSYSVDWNGLDTRRTSVASGIYLYRLTAGKKTKTRKMVLLR